MSPIRPENRDRYPKDWPLIARVLKVLAGDRCECHGECGRGHRDRCEEFVGGYNVSGKSTVLTVAHLNHVPEDCGAENLRVMCAGCHLHYDVDHHRQSRLERERREREQAGQQVLA